eukprot:TRINITY_DN2806_c0_g2_i1.p1 TRINITY_DN2806_c0_g2~~TRINITY_DN2806_c0_g2_i1.p1  ORF type:complete len:306 (+),score=38.38 TRINITY_DN2806_c0_g2_i1:90-1007(+)
MSQGIITVAHQQHVFDVLQRRSNCLLAERPWISPGYSLSANTPAERANAAGEAVSLAAEREALLLVLGDICPSSSTGVRILAHSLEAMGSRLAEVTEAANNTRESVRARTEPEGGNQPRHAVLANPQLLAAIFSFNGRGRWLYLAPVAHAWRTAYMAATARQHGVPWVCVTSGSAAVETPERLEMALACGISVPALTNSCDAQCAAGASGSMEVIRHLHRLGVPTSDAVLFGAARARRTGVLYRFPVLARERNVQVKMSTWMAVYERFLSDSYNDEQQRAALIWLSQQVRPWPVWFCTPCASLLQ